MQCSKSHHNCFEADACIRFANVPRTFSQRYCQTKADRSETAFMHDACNSVYSTLCNAKPSPCSYRLHVCIIFQLHAFGSVASVLLKDDLAAAHEGGQALHSFLAYF
jgi:hypothetical protein